MTIALSGLKPSESFHSMDDLIVIGCSEQHMSKNLTNVIELYRNNNLRLHPQK